MRAAAARRLWPAVALVVLTASAALGGSVGSSPRSISRLRLSSAVAQPLSDAGSSGTATIVVGGVTRTYLLFRPASLPRRPVPLVVVLQGAYSSDAGIEQLTGFDGIAQSRGFVVVYPQPQAGLWHLGCCNALRRSPDDVSFIGGLIDHLVATADVDPSRVYVVGFSVGAAMAYRLACELSSKVAGIGSVGGFEYLSAPCRPRRPVSIFEIHGTSDFYGGSCGGQSQSDVGCGFGQPGYEPSVQQVNTQWRHLDGCPAAVARVVTGPLVEQTSSCRDGTGVRLDTIKGGSHCWPGGAGESTCLHFDASLALWIFLSERPPPSATPTGSGR